MRAKASIIGAADGIIIAAIITTHITNINAASVTVHGLQASMAIPAMPAIAPISPRWLPSDPGSAMRKV